MFYIYTVYRCMFVLYNLCTSYVFYVDFKDLHNRTHDLFADAFCFHLFDESINLINMYFSSYFLFAYSSLTCLLLLAISQDIKSLIYCQFRSYAAF